MATKTFEELKQMAIQIRDEKTNKQNTATRIGTQMLEHLNKLEQEYYDKITLDKRVTELNISELFPTEGIDGSNEYTLAGAIAKVDSKYRTIVGIKITFINNSTSKPETWKYNGGTFTTTTNWVQGDGSGGNLILEWNTDVATTRKQVLQQERKKLLQISYENGDGETINEQYIGTKFTDTEWVKDTNWKSIANANDIYRCQDLAVNTYTSYPLDINPDLVTTESVSGYSQSTIGYQYLSAAALKFLFKSSKEYPVATIGYYFVEVYCADDIDGTNERQMYNVSTNNNRFYNDDLCVLETPYVKIKALGVNIGISSSNISEILVIEQIGNFGISNFIKIISPIRGLSGDNLLTLSDSTFGKTDKSWYISFFANTHIAIQRGENISISNRYSSYKVFDDTEPLIPGGVPTTLISASYNNEDKSLYVYVNGIQYKKYENFVDLEDVPFVLKIWVGWSITDYLAAVALDDKFHGEYDIKKELEYYYRLSNIAPNYKVVWFGDFNKEGTSLKNGLQFKGTSYQTVRWLELPRTDFILSYPSHYIMFREDNATNKYGYKIVPKTSASVNTRICIIEFIDVRSIEKLRINKDTQDRSTVIFLDSDYNMISYLYIVTQADGNGYEDVIIPYNAVYCTLSCGDKGVIILKRRTSMGLVEETPEWIKHKVRDKAIVLPVEFNRFKYNNFGAPNNSERNIYSITSYTDNTLTISAEELKQFYNTSDDITDYAWYDIIVKDAEGDYHRETIAYSSTTNNFDRIKETDDADYVPVYFAACIQQDHPSDYNYRYMGKMMAQCISDVTNYKHLRIWGNSFITGNQYMTTPFGLKAFAKVEGSKEEQVRVKSSFLYQEGIGYAQYVTGGYDVTDKRLGKISNSGPLNTGIANTENYLICRLYGVCPVQNGYFEFSVSSSRQKADSSLMSRIKIIIRNDNIVVHKQLLRGGGNEIISIPNKTWKWGYVEIEFVAVSASVEYGLCLRKADFYELTGFEYYKYGSGVLIKNDKKYPCTSDFTELSSILSLSDSWGDWSNSYIDGKGDEIYLVKNLQIEKLELSLKGKGTTEFDNVVKIILRRQDVYVAGRYRPNNQFFAVIPKGSTINDIARIISESLDIEGWAANYSDNVVTFTANVEEVIYNFYNGVLEFCCSTGEIEAKWNNTTFEPSGDMIWFDTYQTWLYTDNTSMSGYLKKYSKAADLDLYGLGGQTSAFAFYQRLKEALNNGKRYTHAVVEYFTNDQTIDQTYIGACVEMLMANGIKPIIMGSRSRDEGHWKL